MSDSYSAEFAQLRALIGAVREALVEHRGDVATQFARLEGQIEVLARLKTSEHQRIDAAVAALQVDGLHTKKAVEGVMKRVEGLPTARDLADLENDLREVATTATRSKTRLDRIGWAATGLGVGAGLGSGGLLIAVTRILGG